MLEPNKPIFQRKTTTTKPIQPHPARVSQEEIDRKQLLHNEDWLYERKGQPIFVTFLDGEKMIGTVNRIRKFTFVIDTEEHGSVMVYKVGVKCVCEVK